MIGTALRYCFPDDPAVTFYAAGPSNSRENDFRDFVRERERLAASLDPERTLVYFGTCAVYDPEAQHSSYVTHKKAMEAIVAKQARHLILRLPNVVGRTPNPHTLLNYLYARISRSERITIWENARRNLIDVDDVVRIAEWLLNEGDTSGIVNVAAPFDYSIAEIVAEFERILGKPAVADRVPDGSGYDIPLARVARAPVTFRRDYLQRLVAKYYP